MVLAVLVSVVSAAAAASERVTAQPAALPGEVALRVLTFNVLNRNRDVERFRAYVDEHRPDIVLLQEAGRQWVDGAALRDYPFRAWSPRRLVVASRFPILDEAAAAGGAPALRVSLDVGLADPLVVYALHPTSPRMRDGIARQEADYAALTALLAAEPDGAAVIAGGDFNATPTSDVFQALLAGAGMTVLAGETIGVPTRFGRELGLPTWIGVAIDHVIASGRVIFLARAVGPDLGSDHLPVLVDLTVR